MKGSYITNAILDAITLLRGLHKSYSIGHQ